MEALIKTTSTGIMKFPTLDAVAGTTLAEMLEVEHKNLMRTIKQTIESESTRKDTLTDELISESENFNFNAIFKEYGYKDSMNRSRRTYIMNEDALYLVIANTQSRKAHELKVLFKSEFNNMKMERIARSNSKKNHIGAMNQVQRLQEMLRAEGSGATNFIYSTINNWIHKSATGRTMPKGGAKHDSLTRLEDDKVYMLRVMVENRIESLIEGASHTGREIKDHIKQLLKEM